MGKRVAAVLIAAALIVGAVVLRARLDDGDDEVATSPTTVGVATVIVCDESLATECRSAFPAARVEAAGTTIAVLTGRDAEPVTWVTMAPLPQLVDEARARTGLPPLFAATERVATSPLVAVTSEERATLLEATCAPELTLRCIGDNAGKPWSDLGATANLGRVRPSHEPPDASARGALVYAWLATGYFGGVRFNVRDAAFATWAATVERSAPAVSGGSSPTRELIVRQGAFDVALTTEAEATATGATVRGYRILYPSPMVQAEVVVAVGADEVPGSIIDPLRTALTDNGWQAAEGAPTASGLPDAGLVEALRTASWAEVGR